MRAMGLAWYAGRGVGSSAAASINVRMLCNRSKGGGTIVCKNQAPKGGHILSMWGKLPGSTAAALLGLVMGGCVTLSRPHKQITDRRIKSQTG
jgi:hypothetical protein